MRFDESFQLTSRRFIFAVYPIIALSAGLSLCDISVLYLRLFPSTPVASGNNRTPSHRLRLDKVLQMLTLVVFLFVSFSRHALSLQIDVDKSFRLLLAVKGFTAPFRVWDQVAYVQVPPSLKAPLKVRLSCPRFPLTAASFAWGKSGTDFLVTSSWKVGRARARSEKRGDGAVQGTREQGLVGDEEDEEEDGARTSSMGNSPASFLRVRAIATPPPPPPPPRPPRPRLLLVLASSSTTTISSSGLLLPRFCLFFVSLHHHPRRRLLPPHPPSSCLVDQARTAFGGELRVRGARTRRSTAGTCKTRAARGSLRGERADEQGQGQGIRTGGGAGGVTGAEAGTGRMRVRNREDERQGQGG
eukprot:766652-Hanusia_phi.AAC.1